MGGWGGGLRASDDAREPGSGDDELPGAGVRYFILARSIPNDRPLRTVASEILDWLGWTDAER